MIISIADEEFNAERKIFMRESLLTIPISEIFEPKCGCPICRMRDMLEQRTVEYIMGAAMMEPDVRIETNRQGFCKTHYEQLQAQKNRLSLALMLQTHLKKVSDDLLQGSRLFENKNAKKKRLAEVNCDCFVCSKIEWGMERLMVTLFEMYAKSNDFKALFDEQEMLCLPHYDMLLSLSPDKCDKKHAKQFEKSALQLARKYIDTLYADVSKYCSMYDYRNSGRDADWGNSKDSIERAIKFLTSR